jgi:hypothetical protein
MEMRTSFDVAPPGIAKESRGVVVLYVQGSARRKDSAALGTPSAVIRHCDTGEGYFLDLSRKQYWELKGPSHQFDSRLERGGATRGAAPGPSAQAPKVTVRSRTVESGRPRVLFGRMAHHFVTTAKEFVGDPEGTPRAEETIEGWYWPDVRPVSENCVGDDLAAQPSAWIGVPDPIEGATPVFQHSGPSPLGFVVEETRTFRIRSANRAGWETVTIDGRVVEFSEGPLDPSVFQIPSGFAKVPHRRFEPR